MCKQCGKDPKNKGSRGLCALCYAHAHYHGTLDEVADKAKTGTQAAMDIRATFVVGEIKPARDGYVREWTGTEWIAQHRLRIMEREGRDLVKGENVHHINGERADNRIENLELWFRPQPAGQRVAQLIEYMIEAHSDELRTRLALESLEHPF